MSIVFFTILKTVGDIMPFFIINMQLFFFLHNVKEDFYLRNSAIYPMVSTLRKVSNLHRVLRIPPQIKLTIAIYLKYC
jgi:hypothetical protein